jgi:putative spermidine/putrescine transport system permease protein
MAHWALPEQLACDRASRRRLAWLKVREQGFYVLLVAPVVLFLVVFFGLALVSMAMRSFQDGRLGLTSENELAKPLAAGAPTQFRLAHGSLVDLNADGKVDGTDLKVSVVRPLRVAGLDPETGWVKLGEVPPAGQTIVISYNDVAREIAVRKPGGDPSIFQVRHAPVRDRNGDGLVTPADVVVQVEKRVAIAAVEAQEGIVTLAAPIASGEQVRVTYNHREPFTLAHYKRALTSDFYWDWRVWRPSLFRTTLEIALFTTLGCILLGYPVAYLLASLSAGWRTILMTLVVVPYWTSTLVRTFAWTIVLGKEGFINYLLRQLGLVDEPLILVFNRFGVYVGMIHVLLPLAILTMLAVMLGIPDVPLKAAESLGASPLRTFWRVYFPLSLPGVTAAGLLVFILSLGFFITPAVLGSGADRMVSNLIEIQVAEVANWEFGAALAFLLLIPTALLYLVYNRIANVTQLYGTARRGVVVVPIADARGTTGPMRPYAFILRLRRVWHGQVSDLVSHWQRLWRRVWEAIYDRLEFAPFEVRLAVAIAGALLIGLAMAIWVYQIAVMTIAIGLLFLCGLGVLGLIFSRLLHTSPGRLLLILFSALIFLYLVFPNMIVVPISFTRHPVFLSFPGQGLTMQNFQSYFGMVGATRYGAGQWLPATMTSLVVATFVVLLSVPLGSLAAYGLIRGNFSGKGFITYLIISPLVIPVIITAVAIFMFFSRYMRFMTGSMVSVGPFHLPLGFVVAHTILALPYVVVIVSATLRGMDPLLENAAMSLGASRLTMLRRVVLPLMVPGIAASAFFAFLTSFDELVIALFLSTPRVMTLPKRMWDGIRFEVDPTIAAVSTVLVFLTVLMLSALVLAQRYLRRYQRD